jgi:hypothetical protein
MLGVYMASVQRAFVAYSSRDPTLADVIARAVAKANAQHHFVHYTPWVFNDIAGVPLVSPIIEGIEESAFVVADISYLNPNVVYEVGLAIGKAKRAFLIRKRGFEGDKRIGQAAGIFDTLGYEEYGSADELAQRLVSHIDPKPLDIPTSLNRMAPVYVV